MQKLLVISTSAMIIMDQRTMQCKYRIPVTQIYRVSLSPYMDDIVVIHTCAVSLIIILSFSPNFIFIVFEGREPDGTEQSICVGVGACH